MRLIPACKQSLMYRKGLAPLSHLTLWYVESALRDFSLQEMVKVFLLSLHSKNIATQHRRQMKYAISASNR